jgi:hypothetical protein
VEFELELDPEEAGEPKHRDKKVSKMLDINGKE